MEFLKAILGDELFAQVETAINAFNGNEANKNSQVKLANLATGEYVGKGKYDALETQLNSKQTELDTANGLIADFRKNTKGNEELQQKITAYETQVGQLQAQLQEAKIKAAIKVGLLSEKAVDVDYLTFKLESKLKEEGKTVELDDNDNVKGWEDMLSGLKTQFPTMFSSGEGGKGDYKPYDGGGLPKGSNNEAVTPEQFRAMGMDERIALKQKNEALYKQLTNKN